MSERILVTGSTGNVSRELVRSLLEMGQPVVAPAMDERDTKNVPGDGTETVLFRFGSGKRVTGDVTQLLGRPPIAMRQYIEDYADAWQRG